MSKRFFAPIILFIHTIFAFSQAGNSVYSFLDLPVSSRISALGGTNISLRDDDINFAFDNPAMLTKETSENISINMANYLADIQFGTAIFGYNIDNKNYMAVGVQYVDYGTFDGRNDLNQQTGTFTAKDMSLNLIYARPLTDKITIGGTLKPVFSVYEAYTSIGAAIDAGVSYNDKAHLFSAGLVLKNMGMQFKGYYSNEAGQHYESLPFNIELGASKKLAHAPLRLSVTLTNLQRFDLSYLSLNQTNTDGTTSTSTSSNVSFMDMAFRHAIFGAEFIPGKNFYLVASYNYRRQQELQMNGFKSMTGFSFGGGIKLYKFHVGFGMSQFQVGNYSYLFSISTSLSEFRL